MRSIDALFSTGSAAAATKKATIPLPRRQTVKAQAAAKAAAAKGVAKGRTPRKVNPPE